MTFRKGDLLVATMTLLDPNFQQTVVMLCEHEDEAGTYGLILNRPVHAPEEVLAQCPFAEGRLFEGGPVRPEALQVLHPFGEEVPGAQQVLPGVWFGADFEYLEMAFRTGIHDPAACRFFLGYSGWAPDQLAGEYKQRTWVKVPGTGEIVLNTAPAKMWSAAVRQRAGSNPMFAHYPENPMWN